MNKRIIVLVAALLLLLAAGYVSNRFGGGAVAAPSVEVSDRASASAFVLTDLEGRQAALQDYKGKVVYLNFWTTWCKWCKKEMPDLQKVYEAYQDKGLVVLAIDVGETQEKVDAFVREHGYTFPVLLDPDKSVSKTYNVRSIPVTVLVDRDGRVAYQRVGAMNEQQMRAQLDALL